MSTVDEAASRVSERVALIVQAGLEAHQAIEYDELRSPVAEVIEALGLDRLAVPIEKLASTIISWTIFGSEPICDLQSRLQSLALERISEPNARILYRQARLETVRAWRYTHHSAGRDVAHQIGGPEASREELFDGCVDATTGGLSGTGCYLGWPITSEDKHWLLAACEIEQDVVDGIAHINPFPRPNDAIAFWREHRAEVLALTIDPHRRFRIGGEDDNEIPPGSVRDGAKLVIHPVASSAELLDRVIQCANFEFKTARKSWYHLRLRRVRWAREIIAVAREPDRLHELVAALAGHRWKLLGWSVQRRFTAAEDPALEQWLPMERILAGLGLAPDFTMPGAELSGLHNHPIGILLLADDHPLYRDLHLREPIRSGLQWGREQGDESIEMAFEQYRSERRWMATFSPVDLNDPEHLARIDYAEVAHALQKGPFDQRVNETLLVSTAIEQRHMNRLEAALRSKPWTDDNQLQVGGLPRDEPAFLRMRNVGKGALVQVKSALLELADGWRANRMGLDPRELATRQSGAGASQEDLEDGLDALADLFGDIAETEAP